jgi:hypothetical protein
MNVVTCFKTIMRMLIVLAFVATSLPVVSQSVKPSEKIGRASQQRRDAGLLVEEFSFLIENFKLDHQGETNNLNISISYRYAVGIANSDYPDFRLLAKDVEMFLTNYPNEDDYWEILNKQITSLLLKKYPALISVTSELKVAPSRLDPYNRSSRVTRRRPPGKTSHKNNL